RNTAHSSAATLNRSSVAMRSRHALRRASVSGRRWPAFAIPLSSVRAAGSRYAACVDPRGGSSDSFTLAIAHRDGIDTVLDAVRERRPPFAPAAVVAHLSARL